MVDGKSKVLFWVMAMLIVLSVSATFYKSVILEDFEVIESEYAESDEEEVTEEEGILDNGESDTSNEEAESNEAIGTETQDVGESGELDDTTNDAAVTSEFRETYEITEENE